MNYDIKQQDEKMHTLDREITLRPMEGLTPLSGTGAADKRLFTGENKLHAIYNNVYGLWELKYDMGILPGGLEGKFTNLDLLLAHVKQYFGKRNVEITGVTD